MMSLVLIIRRLRGGQTCVYIAMGEYELLKCNHKDAYELLLSLLLDASGFSVSFLD